MISWPTFTSSPFATTPNKISRVHRGVWYTRINTAAKPILWRDLPPNNYVWNSSRRPSALGKPRRWIWARVYKTTPELGEGASKRNTPRREEEWEKDPISCRCENWIDSILGETTAWPKSTNSMYTKGSDLEKEGHRPKHTIKNDETNSQRCEPPHEGGLKDRAKEGNQYVLQ